QPGRRGRQRSHTHPVRARPVEAVGTVEAVTRATAERFYAEAPVAAVPPWSPPCSWYTLAGLSGVVMPVLARASARSPGPGVAGGGVGGQPDLAVRLVVGDGAGGGGRQGGAGGG